MKKMLVTYALPYANGPIHLGHLVGYIQTDIWVRFQKMQPDTECYFVCGDDAHGTPIMLRAEKENISPETLITKMKQAHERDFADFSIEFDNYHSTHSDENKKLVTTIYQRLENHGDIIEKTILQAYDPAKQMFLPDRFVKGNCPRCSAADQYGDNCEACGATYSPSELKNPISVVSGATPIEKETTHLFFNLPNYQTLLKSWFDHKNIDLQPQIKNKLQEWLDDELRPWDISRDAPYFGFEIPDHPNKYFYVWLDAPIGYMASFKNLCHKNPEIQFDDFWINATDTELYHFIGKDIIYFHALFWPAMLYGAQFRLPTAVYAHGFLTVNGQKMSKSRGTFINARTYLNHLNPEYLRYYFATKLNNLVEDIDLNLEDFVARVNADLVGKVVNIASRCAGFIEKYFDLQLSAVCADPIRYDNFVTHGQKIADYYIKREFGHATREIMKLADETNQYIDEKKPWQLIKDSKNAEEVHQICSLGLNLFRIIMTYLKPILPVTAQATEIFLQSTLELGSLRQPLLNHKIAPFKPLLTRIDLEHIKAMQQDATIELKPV